MDDPPDVNVADDLLRRVGEEVDALGDDQGHFGGGHAAHCLEKDLPGALVLGLAPAVRPAKDHAVGLHATEAGHLDQRAQAVDHAARHHNVHEALHLSNRETRSLVRVLVGFLSEQATKLNNCGYKMIRKELIIG